MQCIVTFFNASNRSPPESLAYIEHVSIETQLTCAILQLSSNAAVNLPDIIPELLKCPTSETHCDNQNSSLRDFLLLILLEIVVPSTEKSVTLHLPKETVFDLWFLLSKNLRHHLSAKLCLRLEDYLTCLFNTPGKEKDQWILYRRIISISSELFTKICLLTMDKRVSTDEEDDGLLSSCFLSSIITYDCSKFGCLWKTISKINHDDKLKELWSNGHLDSLASTLLLQTQTQLTAKAFTDDPLCKDAMLVMSERMISMLERKV